MSNIYQLRVVLRGVSPLIWRRLLLRSDSTMAELHAALQIIFGWDDECLHSFHIQGRDIGCESIDEDPDTVKLSEFRLHRGEKFLYAYDFSANWEVDVRLEAVLEPGIKRFYPVCIGGHRAAPPEGCPGPWAYMEELDQHSDGLPLEAIQTLAEVAQVLLEAGPEVNIREAAGDLDELRVALERVQTHQQFRPERFDRRQVNAQLRALGQAQGGERENQSAGGGNRGRTA